ncbi:Glycine cleavage system H protein, mitochondrial [Malassezia restricta CBS 7877]|uniref:Glycine cleavage system H protein n=1 Tax=Malassezia restricta (strain ATCC 96810 / NBRC 103918 / CBS 7877) TaxID=425264 RepID=A0A3G2SA75_MALR7|nr:Glycine cleavage system H protein, mitochondrial [Malassezia restricta CBS 7877]
MLAAPLRTACFSSLRAAARATPRSVPRVSAARSFQTSSVSNAIKTLYTAEHEWLKYNDETNEGVLGITDHAQNSLGDVVYLELPAVELEVSKGDQIGSVESVKAASDIYSPVSGIVSEVNEKLNDEMTLVNKSPEHEGWFAKLRLTNPAEIDELLSEEAYKAILEH